MCLATFELLMRWSTNIVPGQVHSLRELVFGAVMSILSVVETRNDEHILVPEVFEHLEHRRLQSLIRELV